jgi:3-dehydroquinate synthase
MPTTRIRVNLPRDGGDRSYEVLFRSGILGELSSGRLTLPEASSFFIVTDSNVAKLYGKRVLADISINGRKAGMVSFPAGEASKTIETAWNIASELSELGADRESLVLALGGGVVGDLAGFVASIFKRGIDFIQLPTTLLAQVDSSIGGKTGIDTPWGKNQMGTFHQPRMVIIDPLTLRTLPPGEKLNGLAEMIKCAVIASREMFRRLAKVADLDSRIPDDVIVKACEIKARIVSEDETENNLRAVLNYGHTVGHALESASNYRLSHGRSVILGMMAEGWIARRMDILNEGDFVLQSRFLQKVLTEFGNHRPVLNKSVLLKLAMADKKTTSRNIRMSLPVKIGMMHKSADGSYRIPVPTRAFEESIDYLREVLSGAAK